MFEVGLIGQEQYDEVNSFYERVGYGGKPTSGNTVFGAKKNDRLVGVVRLAEEHRMVVLRGLYVASPFQRQGVGRELLAAVEHALGRRDCWCISYVHLRDFYSRSGFCDWPTSDAPVFLRRRLNSYVESGRQVALMKRPGHADPAVSPVFSNVYADKLRADAYAELDFPGTYYLAYRDLPAIISEHIQGNRALDFGCGTGRSTRFLSKLGFSAVVGVDISGHMIAQASNRDPQGDYRLVPDGGLGGLTPGSHDLVLSAFTFDNVPTMDRKVALFRSLKHLLNDGGRVINLVSSPEIYVNEWASFSTRDFPENRTATTGDKVRIVMLDVADKRPVEDILWRREDYLEAYEQAGLDVVKSYSPLASPSESFSWVSETAIAPWVIYVLEPTGQ